MAVHMAVPGQLAASHDNQERVLFARKAVDVLSNKVVGPVFRVVDTDELPVALGIQPIANIPLHHLYPSEYQQ
jgi:hypothetical protein